VSSAPILLASHQTFCENAHLVARHESPSSSVRLKRRQLGSQVDGDKAPNAPDDRATTDLVPTEPSTSGLGQLWRWAARPGRPNAKALVDHATMSSASSTSPSPPIPVRQPLTCFAHPSKAGRSSHARGKRKLAPNPKSTEPANAAPVLLCLSCLPSRSLVRSFACSLLRSPPSALLSHHVLASRQSCLAFRP
jgi:hypothetical protein